MTKIIMHGYQGRMGRVICEICATSEKCEIVAGIDPMPNTLSVPFPTYSTIDDCDMPAHVIIDFSTATAVPNLLNYAKSKKIPIVLCTTGLSNEILELANEASKSVAVFKSSNMSLGINLISNLLKKTSQLLLDSGYDIEIIEKHHNRKIDAPSGTALFLADTIQSSVTEDLSYVYDRSATREKRTKHELGIHAVRGGTIVGEHTVLFAGRDETIELSHSALSKEVFAVGALKAAQFLAGKPAGLYDMQDLMDEL